MTAISENSGSAGSAGAGSAGRTSSLRQGLRELRWYFALAGVALVLAGLFAYVGIERHNASVAATSLRPSGIPANISTPTAALMGLSPVPHSAAPGFRLTDQTGRTMDLTAFRGRVVVLEFMDPNCTDICPIVSQEFVDAYHDLGRAAKNKVVFLAVNVNRYHTSVASVGTFSKEHGLSAIPTWHFFTGPVSALRRVWSQYGVQVYAPGPNADVQHSSIVYFISPDGIERYLASPQVDHTKAGRSYLPSEQLTGWGKGIARVATDTLHA